MFADDAGIAPTRPPTYPGAECQVLFHNLAASGGTIRHSRGQRSPPTRGTTRKRLVAGRRHDARFSQDGLWENEFSTAI